MKKLLVCVLIFSTFVSSVFAIKRNVKEKYEKRDIYKAYSDIYTTDQYGNRMDNLKSLVVGESFYFHIDVTVVCDKNWYEFLEPNNKVIFLDVCFPKTKIFEIKLDDGDGIKNTNFEPKIDSINNTQTYTLKVRSAKKDKAVQLGFIFKCTPISAGDANVTLEFDDLVASDWDKLRTLTYINAYEK